MRARRAAGPRTDPDGTIIVLMGNVGGKPLNAPNDDVVASDGSVWFTDPVSGILNNTRVRKANSRFRFACTGPIRSRCGRRRADDFVRPNGLAFSPDEKKLYIVDSGITHGGPAHIRAFDVDGGTLRNGTVFAEDFAPGLTDGIRLDVDGNVWASMAWSDPAEDGVRFHTPGGDLIGKVRGRKAARTCASAAGTRIGFSWRRARRFIRCMYMRAGQAARCSAVD